MIFCATSITSFSFNVSIRQWIILSWGQWFFNEIMSFHLFLIPKISNYLSKILVKWIVNIVTSFLDKNKKWKTLHHVLIFFCNFTGLWNPKFLEPSTWRFDKYTYDVFSQEADETCQPRKDYIQNQTAWPWGAPFRSTSIHESTLLGYVCSANNKSA